MQQTCLKVKRKERKEALENMPAAWSQTETMWTTIVRHWHSRSLINYLNYVCVHPSVCVKAAG